MSLRKLPPRQIFVLTPEEKRAAACVIGALLLGLGTMFYRAKHPRPAPPPTAKEQHDTKRRATRARAARSSPATVRVPPTAEADRNETSHADEDEQ